MAAQQFLTNHACIRIKSDFLRKAAIHALDSERLLRAQSSRPPALPSAVGFPLFVGFDQITETKPANGR